MKKVPLSYFLSSVFNTIDGLGLRIGAKESIILLFHQYIFALLSLESIINQSKFPLLIFNALVLFISKNLQYNCGTTIKLLVNFPSSCETFLVLTWGLGNISSQSNKVFCFFTRVRVNVIFVEFIIKPNIQFLVMEITQTLKDELLTQVITLV